MRSIVTLCVATALLAFFGCKGGSSPTVAGQDVVVIDPPIDMSDQPDGGTCPNVFFESEALLSNGLTLTWTSSFGGFDYDIGADCVASVEWSLDSGSASFVSFGPRKAKNTFTPRGRDSAEGTVSHSSPGAGDVGATVNMHEMHRAVEPDFLGEIGNGHFWLILDVKNDAGSAVRVKLGVNIHLEDPDDRFEDRCPNG